MPAWLQFRVGYYIYALIFLIFDVEAVFVFPWAAGLLGMSRSRALAVLGFMLLYGATLLGVTLLLVATSLMPYLIGMSGAFYLASALALGAVFVAYAWRMWRSYSDALARKTFGYSIFYLAALFGALLVDHYLR